MITRSIFRSWAVVVKKLASLSASAMAVKGPDTEITSLRESLKSSSASIMRARMHISFRCLTEPQGNIITHFSNPTVYS